MAEQIELRIASLLIGYLCGGFMSAEFVTKRITGKSCRDLGNTGNPGMANVMANLGFKAGMQTLLGDIAKTALACLIAYLSFVPVIGSIAVLWAGIGTTLGHDYPAVYGIRNGGKGVTTCCAGIILYSPLWGLLSAITGMLTVFATQYLCVGGMVIPCVFTLFAFLFYGVEAGILSLFLAVLCIIKHAPAAKMIPSGQCAKTDVLGQIRGLFKKRR